MALGKQLMSETGLCSVQLMPICAPGQPPQAPTGNPAAEAPDGPELKMLRPWRVVENMP